MTRTGHSLAVLYTLAVAGMAHAATVSGQRGSVPYTLLYGAAAVLFTVAVAYQAHLADERRRALEALERAARPDPQERAIADHIALGWNDLNAACCLTWWETRGTAHDPVSCPRMDSAA